MSRRRYVYREVAPGQVEAFEVGEEWRATNRDGGHKSEEEIYGKLQATDGTDISTRRRHREYQKAHGVTLADDYRDTWAKAEEKRAAFYTGNHDGRAVREAVEKAIHTLTTRRRR